MSGSNKFYLDRAISRTELIVLIVCFVVAGFALSFAIIAYTPVRNLIPGYPTATVRHQQLQTMLKIDSLERCICRWELYSDNLRRIVAGEAPVQIESIISQFDGQSGTVDEKMGEKVDSALRKYVEDEKKFELSESEKKHRNMEGIQFFRPMVGTVTRHFDYTQSPFIDITAPEGSPVKSVLAGSVIYTGWSELDGWCLIIQHESGIISIYKHNQKVLKDVSEKVSAGTAIALLGNSGADATKGTHLHFELWQDGSPVDPTQFITF